MAGKRKETAPVPEREELEFGFDGVLAGPRTEIEKRIREQNFPHAVLLEAGDSTLSRRAALTAAAGLLCGAQGDRPCGRCAACIKVRAGGHPDLTVLQGSGGQRSLHVEDIRALRRDSIVLPNEAEVKVYVLLGAQEMSEQAQNALLKVLEEPPERVRFLLTCDDRAHLLSTVLSRCTCYSLDGGCLVGADGRAREIAVAIAAAVTGPGELELMRCTAAFEKDRQLMAEVLAQLTLLFRRAMIFKAGRDMQEGPEADEAVRKLAVGFSIGRLAALIQAVRTMEDCMARNANQNLMITRLSALLRSAAGR